MVSVLSANGANLVYSTYVVPDSAIEEIDGDRAGNIYFSGPIKSSLLRVTANAPFKILKGARDGYQYFRANGERVIGGHAESAAGFPVMNAYDSTVSGNDTGAFRVNAGFFAVFDVR